MLRLKTLGAVAAVNKNKASSHRYFKFPDITLFKINKNKKLTLGLLSLILTIITATPASSAERIYFFVGPAQFSLSLNSLENFAKTGVIDRNLSLYFRGATPEQIEKFRQALLLTKPVNPIAVSQFFNTPMGESILLRMGQLINTTGGINGKFALRSALIKSSLEPEGLNILNLLRNFPLDIRLNTQQILRTAADVELIVTATNTSIEKMGQLNDQEAKTAKPVDFAAMVDPRKPGPYSFERQVFTLNDTLRQRTFRVILYKPQSLPEEKIKIIVISHGLASRPEDFEKYAQQLSSYGFVVALPVHPGSDVSQFQAMLEGRSREVFKIQEFSDRPKDVSYLLDELSKRNETEFEGKLDLENVGFMGHSFGGYTGLALAGATLNFENLKKDCENPNRLPNASLLLQCRALELPPQPYNFFDPRIKAVFSLNPVNSSLFGRDGIAEIAIPVFIFASSQDIATPVVFEQLRSFVWLNQDNKYLALARGGGHTDISQLDAGTQALIDSLPGLTFADRAVLDNYSFSMMVAFFQVYLHQDQTYSVFLNANYAQYISVQPFPLYLITSVSREALIETLRQFKPQR